MFSAAEIKMKSVLLAAVTFSKISDEEEKNNAKPAKKTINYSNLIKMRILCLK